MNDLLPGSKKSDVVKFVILVVFCLITIHLQILTDYLSEERTWENFFFSSSLIANKSKRAREKKNYLFNGNKLLLFLLFSHFSLNQLSRLNNNENLFERYNASIFSPSLSLCFSFLFDVCFFSIHLKRKEKLIDS